MWRNFCVSVFRFPFVQSTLDGWVKRPKPNESSSDNASNSAPTPESDVSQIGLSKSNESIAIPSEGQIDSDSTTMSIGKLDIEAQSKECIESFEVRDKSGAKFRYVRCKICMAFPNIVKINTDNIKLISLKSGSSEFWKF